MSACKSFRVLPASGAHHARILPFLLAPSVLTLQVHAAIHHFYHRLPHFFPNSLINLWPLARLHFSACPSFRHLAINNPTAMIRFSGKMSDSICSDMVVAAMTFKSRNVTMSRLYCNVSVLGQCPHLKILTS